MVPQMITKDQPMKINVEQYWTEPPPEPSPRCTFWYQRIKEGWRPNKRIRGMGFQEAAEFYGVYIWEYFHIIRPLLNGKLD